MRLRSNMGCLSGREPAVEYCSRRPCPSPLWVSRFVGARAVGPLVDEPKLLGKTFLGGNPSPEMTYLPIKLTIYMCRNMRLLVPVSVISLSLAILFALQFLQRRHSPCPLPATAG